MSFEVVKEGREEGSDLDWMVTSGDMDGHGCSGLYSILWCANRSHVLAQALPYSTIINTCTCTREIRTHQFLGTCVGSRHCLSYKYTALILVMQFLTCLAASDMFPCLSSMTDLNVESESRQHQKLKLFRQTSPL